MSKKFCYIFTIILAVILSALSNYTLVFGLTNDAVSLLFKPTNVLLAPSLSSQFVNGDDQPRLSWEEIQLIDKPHLGYEIMEANNPEFNNPTSYFYETQPPIDFSSRLNGVYHYRVRTWCRFGSSFKYSSEWSNAITVKINHKNKLGPDDGDSDMYSGDDHATYLSFTAGTFIESITVYFASAVDDTHEFDRVYDFNTVGSTPSNKIIQKDITAFFHYGPTFEIFANNKHFGVKSNVLYQAYFYDGVTWQPIASSIDQINEVVEVRINRFGRYAIKRVDALDSDIRGYAVPNPFTPNHGTFDTATFVINNSDASSDVEIKIFDLNGVLIKQLDNVRSWDGTNNDGVTVHGGVYVYQIKVDDQILSGTIVVIR